MRIIDVRKLNRGYVVYVNEPYDIETLDNDKRFQELTTYYKNRTLLGKEYYFTFVKPESCSKIQTYLRQRILGVAQEKKPEKKKDVFTDAPSESFLNRGINKEHRKRQPKIIKEAFSKKHKRRNKK